MSTTPVDLSAGIVGGSQAPPQQQPPPSGGGVDLSAGIVGQQQQQNASPDFTGLGVAKGAGTEALGMAASTATTLLPGQQQLLDSIKEIPATYRAYEMARSQGKNPMEAVAAADQAAKNFSDTHNMFKQRAAEFAQHPDEATGKTLVDLVALISGAKMAGRMLGIGGGEAGAEAAAEGAGAETQAPKPGIVKQVVQGAKAAQPEAETALRGAAQSAQESTGVSGPQPESLRTSLKNPIDSLESSAKAKYRSVDEAAGTDFKQLNDKLENTNYQLRQLTETEADVAKEQTLQQSKNAILQKIEDAKALARTKGIDPDILNQADAQFRQMSALKDLEAKVFKNPSNVTGDVAHGSPEAVQIDSALRQLQKLDDNVGHGSSRLEQALGPDGAKKLLDQMHAAQRSGAQYATRQQWARWIATATGVGAAAGGTGSAILHAIQ